MKNFTAVLFDMDGTLIDSEPNWWVADARFVETFGGTYDETFRNECIGMGSRNFALLIQKKFGLSETLDELMVLKDRLYLEAAAGNTHAFPEMVKLVRALSDAKVPVAVASGSSLPIIQQTLTEAGIRDFFGDHIYSSDQVARAKPFPDVFEFAAQKLSSTPGKTLVFEDSRPGVEAGLAAGMAVCAVPQVWTEAGAPTFVKADLLFREGMRGFTADAVLAWMGLALVEE